MAGLRVCLSALALLMLFDVSFGSHCDANTNYPLTVIVRKFPDLMIVKQGEKFDISATFHVTKRLPSKFKIQVKLWKKVVWWIGIRCVNNVGSCDYPIDCNKMNCTQILDMCTNCKIAVDDVTITIPINLDFPGYFVNGKYWVGYKIYDATNKTVIACGEQYMNVKI